MKQTAIRRSNFKICKLYVKLSRLTKETPIYQFTFHHTLGYTCRRLRRRYLFLDETQNYYLGKQPHLQVWSSDKDTWQHTSNFLITANNLRILKECMICTSGISSYMRVPTNVVTWLVFRFQTTPFKLWLLYK